MKKLKCDLCDYEAEGDPFEDWMNALKPHYVEVHADVMNSKERNTGRNEGRDDEVDG